MGLLYRNRGTAHVCGDGTFVPHDGLHTPSGLELQVDPRRWEAVVVPEAEQIGQTVAEAAIDLREIPVKHGALKAAVAEIADFDLLTAALEVDNRSSALPIYKARLAELGG